MLVTVWWVPWCLTHTDAYVTAPEREYMRPRPQGRTRRDSIQVSTMHFSNQQQDKDSRQCFLKNLSLCFLLFCVCVCQSYKMDASPCGHCLIINNVEFEPQSELNDRKGSNVDCDKLERRFKALNFIVEVKTNLKQRVRVISSAAVSDTTCTYSLIHLYPSKPLKTHTLSSYLSRPCSNNQQSCSTIR